MIPDATFGSESWSPLGSWPTAKVDVHPCRLPFVARGSLEGSPQPERSRLIHCLGGSGASSVRSLGPETLTPAHAGVRPTARREPLLFLVLT